MRNGNRHGYSLDAAEQWRLIGVGAAGLALVFSAGLWTGSDGEGGTERGNTDSGYEAPAEPAPPDPPWYYGEEPDMGRRAEPPERIDTDGNGRITCREARAAGIAPVHRDDPAYAWMRDGDGDGVVCE